MEKAILIKNAVCNGSGSDRFKTVSGLTKNVLEQVEKIAGKQNIKNTLKMNGKEFVFMDDTFGNDNVVLLAHSHTSYQGQNYKQIVKIGSEYQTHRQINDADFEIIATI